MGTIKKNRYLYLISRDSGKLKGIASFLGEECVSIKPSFYKLFLKYIIFNPLKLKTVKFKKNEYEKLIKNNLQRKLIRNTYIFRLPLVLRSYKYSLLVKCYLLERYLLDQVKKNQITSALIWNGSLFPQSMFASFFKTQGLSTVYFENGHFPNTIQADPKGINYNSSVIIDPEFYLNKKFKDEDFLPDQIGKRVTKLDYSNVKYKLPEDYYFVPFQVPSDMQVLELSPWIKDMKNFYNYLYQATFCVPGIKFVIKEHPSYKVLIKDKVQDNGQITFANGMETEELIRKSKGVITINSTVGMEALLLNKKVITLGLAMYNLEGMVLNALSFEEFIVAINKIQKGWEPKSEITGSFIKYIYNYFLIKGNYDSVNETMVKRIRTIS